MAIATTSPVSGEVLKAFDELSPEELEDKLARAAAAASSYRHTTIAQRADWLNSAADVLERDAGTVSELITTEIGKTLRSAADEVGKCVAALRFYAEHGAVFLSDVSRAGSALGARLTYVTYQPLGVILAVMPWNFPLWQAMRFAAPALTAGNVGLLKHASNVPQTALYMEQLFREAGFPEDVFQTLLISSGTVERVLRDDRVKAATLTGSEPAGRSVAAIAGDEIKRVVLELGGSDPFIVMPSADIERAADVAVRARTLNNGQSCVNAKRFFIHTDIYDAFLAAFVTKMKALVVGDPIEPGTDIGPLATEAGREDVEAYVNDAVDKGATVLTGGKRIERPGWFYPPTVITDVTREMRMFGEEVFGPVAQVFPVSSLAEAVDLANEHPYGLGSNLWSEDEAERETFIRDIQSGMAFINGHTASYPEIPFGGIKRSGYGRELADVGMKEFMNAKTVWVGESASPETSSR
ncbi:succinate-semialdehyde dehydrogenase/glutarate-semialdehyde dehydrogenase [Mycolicibacterium sp. BK556]|uniref:NADP-dependent succinic semialdehyde dehydrogenase n=1 Tax=unclassified Mycolicibacterium TaxID=2636767 RepID=UPI0016117712|nr:MULTISPECIES: NADP-dependent succinic semialdehyde dehydrogenase [unclassified Mycolicibacterium]MBB3602616.1 succinate-semialdehyde dehydrogenase/glutarate-semialdehyde dehydrogenase [Mycolicibacterium sp. BK556]MBB3632368.1 succinate-semialdehyde dehydrogenase/glutarate-semialdehyde dehydrogenase [Mycolicibacterium sp. BK607]